MDDLSTYLKKEIVRYVKSETDKGNSIEHIRKALLEAGHHHNLVQEAIGSLQRHNWDVIKAMNEPVKGRLQEELFYDVLNSLVRYIEYNIAQGKSIHEIESMLLKYGHSQESVTSAVETVLARRGISQENVNYTTIAEFGGAAVLVLLAIILSISTNTSLGRVVVGLLPTLLTLVFAVILIEKLKVRSLLIGFPFLFVLLFVAASYYGNIAVFEGMNVKTLAIVNLLISLFYVAIMLMAASEEEEEIKPSNAV